MPASNFPSAIPLSIFITHTLQHLHTLILDTSQPYSYTKQKSENPAVSNILMSMWKEEEDNGANM
jgi:hypothetical protein